MDPLSSTSSSLRSERLFPLMLYDDRLMDYTVIDGLEMGFMMENLPIIYI